MDPSTTGSETWVLTGCWWDGSVLAVLPCRHTFNRIHQDLQLEEEVGTQRITPAIVAAPPLAGTSSPVTALAVDGTQVCPRVYGLLFGWLAGWRTVMNSLTVLNSLTLDGPSEM